MNKGSSVKGYVRVVNYRTDMQPDAQPENDETVVAVDRRNPVLGNKHYLRVKTDLNERHKVIAAFTRDLESDFVIKGPMHLAIRDLANRVHSGEKITLQCACKPSPCHGDVIAKKINEMVDELEKALSVTQSNQFQETKSPGSIWGPRRF